MNIVAHWHSILVLNNSIEWKTYFNHEHRTFAASMPHDYLFNHFRITLAHVFFFSQVIAPVMQKMLLVRTIGRFLLCLVEHHILSHNKQQECAVAFV